MADPREILQAVSFDEGFDADALHWHDATGFVRVDADVAAGGLRLVGFGTPLARDGGMDRSWAVRPLTEFNELPPEHRTIDEQGKGVGPRLYNTREALGGARERPDEVGVYMFDVHPSRLLDRREAQGSALTQIGRHAIRMLRSRYQPLEAVVEGIHASYEDSDAVELRLPPNPLRRQVARHIGNLVPPQFMIIRNPDTTLHRVGTTTAPW